jgi:3-(3-hydroxy-phenyl)propionate hydroxylase
VLVLGGTAPEGLHVLQPDITDVIRARYLGDARAAIYLIRPDQVVAARWHAATAVMINAATDAAQMGRT